jgi:hypothetical protein
MKRSSQAFKFAIIIFSFNFIIMSCSVSDTPQNRVKLLKEILPTTFFNDSCFNKYKSARVVDLFIKDTTFLSEQSGRDFDLEPKNEILDSLSTCEKIAFVKLLLDEDWNNYISIDKIMSIKKDKTQYGLCFIPDNIHYIIKELKERYPQVDINCYISNESNRYIPTEPDFTRSFCTFVDSCGCCK